MSRLERLESLKELLKADRKTVLNQQYWQNERNITEHIVIYGVPLESERFYKVELRR